MKTIKRIPWLYILLAYGWAWLLWIPVALLRVDYQSSPALVALLLLGVFGPGMAGILLTYRDANHAARGDFWKRAFDLRRIRWTWIALMLVLWPALHLAANGLAQVLGRPAPASELVAQITAQAPYALVVVILYFLQALLEDLGWRGYMGERLLQSFSPGRTALLVGFFHSFWHLPLFFVVGTNQITMGLGLNFWAFVAQAVAFSFIATWCYVDNGHSTLAAVLLHTVGNLSNDIFTLQGGTLKFQVYTVLMVLAALAIHAVMARAAWVRVGRGFLKAALP